MALDHQVTRTGQSDPALPDRWNNARRKPWFTGISRVKAGIAAGKRYQTIQIDNVGHTLELEGDRDFPTFLTVRLPLLWSLFGWLNTEVWVRE